MRTFFIFVLLVSAVRVFSQPVALHPENPHYFIYNNQPVLLISSSEHYGAILNSAFDYKAYLKTLAKDGLNYARVFTGTYVEKPGDFGIEHNTLAPDSGMVITPWKRSNIPGYFNGGNKFDLSQWNDDYFVRVKDFLKEAGKLNIIVEITLFSSQYRGWIYSPLHHTNNVNKTDAIERDFVHTMHNGNLIQYQEAFVRKMVHELNSFDNFFFEIQNEPYADAKLKKIPINTYQHQWKEKALQRIDLAVPQSMEWQKKIAELIAEEEKKLPKKHLIAQNYANFFYPLENVGEHIDILNFHYNYPIVNHLNYGFNKPISFDEAGFAIKNDSSIYRKQAWNFILSGGAVYNNLDYSFAVGYENGTCKNNAPGFGGIRFRKQMGILKSFMQSFDFQKMKPDYAAVAHAPGAVWQALSEKGKQYAIYLDACGTVNYIVVNLPQGKYRAEWLNTKNGTVDRTEIIKADDSNKIRLETPGFTEDIALRIKAIR